MSDPATHAPRFSTRGAVLALLLVTGFFTTAALAHVWVRLQIVRLGYQISRETTRETRLQQLHRKLEVERALLRSPTRLEQEAKARFHLEMPDPGHIFTLPAHASKRRPSWRGRPSRRRR